MLALIALAVVVYDETHSALATTAMFLAMEFLPSLLAPALTARVERLPVARLLTTIYGSRRSRSRLARAAHPSLQPAARAASCCAVDGTLAVARPARSRVARWRACSSRAGLLREGNALLNLGSHRRSPQAARSRGVLVGAWVRTSRC